MKNGYVLLLGLILTGVFAGVFLYSKPDITSHKFVYRDTGASVLVETNDRKKEEGKSAKKEVLEEKVSVSRVKTPNVMRAVYSTMWSISSKNKREYFLKLMESTDLNSIVIDVKGSDGELIFDKISNLKEIIDDLHKKNIYTIARVVVFQDSGLAKTSPEFSLKKSDGSIWRDRRGYAWSDPASKGAWDHNIKIAKRAIDVGFDEINYDYIRFPTDGDLTKIVYPFWDGIESKSSVIKRFGAYSKEKLKEYDKDIKLSLDIFGYTFLRGDGLGIGQKLVDMLDNFDYIYPMVYPSHFGAGNFGFQNPADYPYEVVSLTLDQGLDSLGEKKEEAKPKIRPWIQVFDLGAEYTPAMIEAQIKATYDVLGKENTGWLMWSPRNDYDEVLIIEL